MLNSNSPSNDSTENIQIYKRGSVVKKGGYKNSKNGYTPKKECPYRVSARRVKLHNPQKF
jgi:hypothetical protein